MASSPAISVIIPVFNTEDYLKDALGSICNQTVRDLQIIVVDDGSTDSSPQILRQIADKDSRIEIITQPNQGQGAARNRGLEKARGEYVYFMDSDDLLEPTCLEDCLRLCSATGLDYVTFDASSFDENGPITDGFNYDRSRLICSDRVWDSKKLLKFSLDNNSFRASPVLFLTRRKLLTDNEIRFPEGIIHEDNAFVLKLMLCAGKSQYIPEAYFKRRVRSGSTMTTCFSLKNIKAYTRIADTVKNWEQSQPQWTELIELYLHKTLNSVVWLAHRLKPAEKAETLKLFSKHRLVKYASLRNWCVFIFKK